MQSVNSEFVVPGLEDAAKRVLLPPLSRVSTVASPPGELLVCRIIPRRGGVRPSWRLLDGTVLGGVAIRSLAARSEIEETVDASAVSHCRSVVGASAITSPPGELRVNHIMPRRGGGSVLD